MIIFPRIAKQIDCFVKHGYHRVILANVADILAVYFIGGRSNYSGEFPAQLPKIRIRILASLFAVKRDINVKLFSVQLVVTSSEILVEFKGEPLLSLSVGGKEVDVFVDSSLHLPFLSSCS